MATKSIYKEVRVTNKTMCKKLLAALENAERKGAKKVVMSKNVQNVSGQKIKDLFGAK